MADQLGSLETEQRLGLTIDERDSSLPVDDDHRVGRGLYQLPEQLVRRPGAQVSHGAAT